MSWPFNYLFNLLIFLFWAHKIILSSSYTGSSFVPRAFARVFPQPVMLLFPNLIRPSISCPESLDKRHLFSKRLYFVAYLNKVALVSSTSIIPHLSPLCVSFKALIQQTEFITIYLVKKREPMRTHF